MVLELNPQQRHATKFGVNWYKSQMKQTYEISGPAGSGKTTIVQSIVDAIGLKPEEVLYVAYVGKAAQNLALRGHNARTIHSAIYQMVNIPKVDGNGNYVIKNNRIVTMRTFVKKEEISPLIKLIVVDEGGMVNIPIKEDLLSFGVPIIALGDLNQLPPVFGKPGFIVEPDVILTQIMRQAEDSEIIWMSQQILAGKEIPYGRYNNSMVIPFSDVKDEYLTGSSQIICGRNSTRDNINNYMRKKIYEYSDREPIHIGEKIICRRNDWDRVIGDNIYLINGMIGYVKDVHYDSLKPSSIEIDFQPDFLPDDMYYRRLRIDLDYLRTPAAITDNKMSYNSQFQHGNAISVYLSQGSQYDSVFYHRDSYNRKKFQKALDYTAITRAVNGIIIAM